MRKSILMLIVAMIAFAGCEKKDDVPEDPAATYTTQQEKAFDVLSGSFQAITKVAGIEIKGTILSFNKRLDEPKGIKGESYMAGENIVFFAHGEGHSEDASISSLSYDFYYSVSETGDGLKLYKKKNKYGIRELPYKDCVLKISSKDQFTIYWDSALPAGGIDTYYRIK